MGEEKRHREREREGDVTSVLFNCSVSTLESEFHKDFIQHRKMLHLISSSHTHTRIQFDIFFKENPTKWSFDPKC